jgi:hypothetical protein
LLGAALYADGLSKVLLKKKANFTNALSRLPAQTSQEALLLLRLSLAAPKLIHLMRSSDCAPALHLLEEFDEALRIGLEGLLNSQLPAAAFQRACLPARMGGLGVRRLSDLRMPCYLTSLVSSAERVRDLLPASAVANFEEHLQEVSRSFPVPETFQGDLGRQMDVDSILCEERYRDILDEASPSLRACMLAAREPLSFAWLHVIPNAHLGTCIDDETISCAVRYRLHVPQCQPIPCRLCEERLDALSHHALSCPRSAGRWFRHSALNNEIAAILRKVGAPSTREPSGTHLDPTLRPDGTTILPWSHGKFLAWDATVVDTLAPSYLRTTSLRAGAAAAGQEQRKRHKYRDMLPEYIFCPLGFETLGPMGPSAKEFFSQISRRLALATVFASDSVEYTYLMQRVSTILIKANRISLVAASSGV